MEQILGTALIPEVDYTSTSYGSVLLKSLQTEKLPELDLLVREAVQNSSDASLQITQKNTLYIDFTYGEFDTQALCSQLGKVGAALLASPSACANYRNCLEIRDRYTTGLTGPYKKEELCQTDHGNYFKLIFDSGINQTQSGAGGNWGFGKSVYYRVSRAGIVVYYSQIRVGDPNDLNAPIQERLVVTMVEDESSADAVLPSIATRPSGRAWWGRTGTDVNTVLPITDHGLIESFLHIFNLKPFKQGETGTSVIIPFIDEDKVLNDIIPTGSISSDIEQRCIWKNSVPQYIEHALQKWYAPRIANSNLNDVSGACKKLRATIHAESSSKTLSAQKMDGFFKLVQDLYNAALYSCKSMPLPKKSSLSEIKTHEIRINNDGLRTRTAGYVAYTKTTNRLIYGQQAALDPYVLTGNFNNNSEENEPIVMCAREPGMIISYSIDGTWSKGVKAPACNGHSSSDEYIIAFFVPKTDNEFNPDSKAGHDGYDNLGSYIRACEESDHASWEDKTKYRIIGKIKTNVGKKIADGTIEVAVESINASASRLSGRIGNALLPARGALATSSKPQRPKGAGSGGGASNGSKPSFTTKDAIWKNGVLIIPFEMSMGSLPRRTIKVEAQAEGGRTISPKTWSEDIGGPFPVHFSRATACLHAVAGDDLILHCDADSQHAENGPLKASLNCQGGRLTIFEIECSVPAQTITGELELKTSDKTIEFAIKALKD